MRISRRAVLATAGVSPLIATAAKGERARQHAADVVVVGAGAAGIEAARLLMDAGKSVTVLEASSAIGGRMKPGKLAGEVIDLGAQWAGPGQDRFYARAAALGVKTTPQPDDGANITYLGGKAYRSGGPDSMPPEDGRAFQQVAEEFTRLANSVYKQAPWSVENAAALDRQSVSHWIDRNVERTAIRQLVRSIIRVVCCVEPSQISMLGWARYMASAGGFLPLIDVAGGAQQDTFAGGAFQIVDKNAEPFRERIMLNAPVKAVSQTNTGVVVESAAGNFEAERVIVTAPPALAVRIAFDPPVSAMRDALSQRMPMGSVIKCMIAFDQPFWREMGLNGQVTTDGDFVGFFEKSLSKSSAAALVGFFAGESADRWGEVSPMERRNVVLDTIAAAFGAAPPAPIDYVDFVWRDHPWVRGGYTGIPMPNTLLRAGPALVEPHGRVHWAGTETSSVWTGYVEGALASAERAVGEVLPLLTH